MVLHDFSDIFKPSMDELIGREDDKEKKSRRVEFEQILNLSLYFDYKILTNNDFSLTFLNHRG